MAFQARSVIATKTKYIVKSKLFSFFGFYFIFSSSLLCTIRNVTFSFILRYYIRLRFYAVFFTDLALTVTTLVLLITRCYKKSWKRGLIYHAFYTEFNAN